MNFDALIVPGVLAVACLVFVAMLLGPIVPGVVLASPGLTFAGALIGISAFSIAARWVYDAFLVPIDESGEPDWHP